MKRNNFSQVHRNFQTTVLAILALFKERMMFKATQYNVYYQVFRSFVVMIVLSGIAWMGVGCQPETFSQKTPVRAINGVLDLSDWKFEVDGPIALDGEWEFYWESLLEPSAFKTAPYPEKTGLFSMPSYWNGYEKDNMKLPGKGYATFHLTLKLPPSPTIKTLNIGTWVTAYTLWFNDKIVASSGRVGTNSTDSKAGYGPQMIPFQQDDSTVRITLQASNYVHRNGGFLEGFTIGTISQISAKQAHRIGIQVFMTGCFFIIGMYHLVLYILRRKDISLLYFGVFCLLYALWNGSIGGLSLQAFSSIPWEVGIVIEYLCFYLAVPAFLSFFHARFPDEFSKTIIKGFQGIGVIFAGIVLVTPPEFYMLLPRIYHVIAVLALFYMTYGLARAVMRKRDHAMIMLLGNILLFLTFLNDMLYIQGVINTGFGAPIGFLVFTFLQATILAVGNQNAHNTVEIQATNLKTQSNELREKNQLLEAQSEELSHLDRLKDEFLANTSHELRTPLHGIIGLSESLLEGNTGSFKDQDNETLRRIIESGQRLVNLINNILDFSKLKHADLTLDLQPLNLKAVTDMVLILSQPLLANKNVRLLNSIDHDLPAIFADENRVQQILHNLIGNAIKFTPEGQIEITAQIQEENLLISVIDTGIGIPSDKLENIFLSFEQVDSTETRRYGGTGLGLTLTKQLIELHGGEITVQSRVDQGSTFTFTLPLAQEVEASYSSNLQTESIISSMPTLIEIPPSEKSDLNHFTILVVDDDPINVRIVYNHLHGNNYYILPCYSGKEALQILESSPLPDLILLDVMMSEVSGFEICRTIRKRYSRDQLPIIFLTAKGELEDLVRGLELGANDYVTKPFYKAELLARIQNHLQLFEAFQRLISLKRIAQFPFNHFFSYLSKELTDLHFSPFPLFLKEDSPLDPSYPLFYQNLAEHVSEILEISGNTDQEIVILNNIEEEWVIKLLGEEHFRKGHLALLNIQSADYLLCLHREPGTPSFSELDRYYFESLIQTIQLRQDNQQSFWEEWAKQTKQIFDKHPINQETVYVQSQTPYCSVFQYSGEESFITTPLHFLERFYSEHLIKIGQSTLINPQQILTLEKDTARTRRSKRKAYNVKLRSKKHNSITLPVGPKYVSHLQDHLLIKQ